MLLFAILSLLTFATGVIALGWHVFAKGVWIRCSVTISIMTTLWPYVAYHHWRHRGIKEDFGDLAPACIFGGILTVFLVFSSFVNHPNYIGFFLAVLVIHNFAFALRLNALYEDPVVSG